MNNITYSKNSIGRLERKTPTDYELLTKAKSLLNAVLGNYNAPSRDECMELNKEDLMKTIKQFLNK